MKLFRPRPSSRTSRRPSQSRRPAPRYRQGRDRHRDLRRRDPNNSSPPASRTVKREEAFLREELVDLGPASLSRGPVLLYPHHVWALLRRPLMIGAMLLALALGVVISVVAENVTGNFLWSPRRRSGRRRLPALRPGDRGARRPPERRCEGRRCACASRDVIGWPRAISEKSRGHARELRAARASIARPQRLIWTMADLRATTRISIRRSLAVAEELERVRDAGYLGGPAGGLRAWPRHIWTPRCRSVWEAP